MDLSLHPTPQSECSRTRTGASFTIRSANSPNYVFCLRPARPSPRRSAPPLEERDRGQTEGPVERVCREKEQSPNEQGSTVSKGPRGTRDCRSFITVREGEKASDPNMSDWSDQNNTGGEATVVACSDGRDGHCNPAPVIMRGRTEWRRRQNLSSRSKSLDWRDGAPGPERDTRADLQGLSRNQGKVVPKRAESLERRGTLKGPESSVMSKVKAFNSAGTTPRSPGCQPSEGDTETGLRYVGLGLERTAKGLSLPSRLHSHSGPSSASGSRETASSFGPKAGQSILERIEKLYGPTGMGQTEDSRRAQNLPTPLGMVWDLSVGDGQPTTDTHHRRSASESSSSQPPTSQWRRTSQKGESGETFPRRFSKLEKCSPTPQQNSTADACPASSWPNNAPADPAGSVSPVSPVPALTGEGAAAGAQRCGGALELHTRPVDRSRDKHATAAEVRSARTAGTFCGARTQPQTVPEEGRRGSSQDPATPRETGMDNSEDKDGEDGVEGLQRMNGIRRRTGESGGDSRVNVDVEEGLEHGRWSSDRGKGSQTKGENGMTDRGLIKDVLQSGTHKMTERKAVPERTAVPSADSVRNKISQFEALTQKVQTSAMGRFALSRRAFSVPAELSRAGEGVKKSRSDRAIVVTKGGSPGVREGGSAGNPTGEEVKDSCVVKRHGSETAMAGTRRGIKGGEEEDKLRPGSASVGEVGVRNRDSERGDTDVAVSEVKNHAGDFGKPCRPEGKPGIPLSRGGERQRLEHFYIDETDFCKAASPEKPRKREAATGDAPSSPPRRSAESSDGLLCLAAVQDTQACGHPSPVSDDDKTPTNTPDSSPFLPRHPLTESSATVAGGPRESSPLFSDAALPPERDPRHLLLSPLTTSSFEHIPAPKGITLHPGGEKQDKDLDTWVTSLKIQSFMCFDDEDDDEGTEKDEDSNYDSDSAESSVTIMSNMSQMDHRSFSVSLADLCNFGGLDYESDNNSDDLSPGQRSASLSSDMSALSCVSVLPSEELDRLLEDVRGLGDTTLQNYEDVQVVVLHKDVGVGLGFSMAGGVDQNKPVTVHRVFPSGVAAQEGSIREGDHVLSINGTAMCGSTHWEALRTLRKAKTRGMAVVVLRRAGISSPSKRRTESDSQGRTQTLSTNTGHRLCVRLEKQSRDLGFSLEGGIGSSLGDKPLSIQKIFQGGPFSKVCPGDEVLEIQGVSMIGMRRLEAWTLIRRLPPGPVDVVLHRPVKPPEM